MRHRPLGMSPLVCSEIFVKKKHPRSGGATADTMIGASVTATAGRVGSGGTATEEPGRPVLDGIHGCVPRGTVGFDGKGRSVTDSGLTAIGHSLRHTLDTVSRLSYAPELRSVLR